MMTPTEFEFLKENEVVMRSSVTVTKETKTQFYAIYNRLTGLNKRPNACGRCFTNVVRLVKHYYENYKQI